MHYFMRRGPKVYKCLWNNNVDLTEHDKSEVFKQMRIWYFDNSCNSVHAHDNSTQTVLVGDFANVDDMIAWDLSFV